MKTIGILSYSNSKIINYGGILQAYALKTFIEEDCGCSCYQINYIVKPFYTSKYRKILSQFYKAFLSLFGSKKRKTRTLNFWKRNFKSSAKPLFTTQDLVFDSRNYDCLLLGSDQIWNPYINNFDSNFFGSFYNNGINTVYTYAASFGRACFKEKDAKFIVENLNGLHNVSVRETQGKEFLEGFNIESHVDIDPTLLLDRNQWQTISKQSKLHLKTKYILCYIMPGDKTVENEIKRIAKFYSKSAKLKIIFIGQKETKRLEKHNRFDFGPAEWIDAMLNASLIITNSFHGVAFSVNFNKDFFAVFPSNQSNSSLTSRISSLLMQLNLENRIFQVGDTMNSNLTPIDYKDINAKLDNMRKQSRNYLISLLS